jgi:Cysteine-rich secretory protein family
VRKARLLRHGVLFGLCASLLMSMAMPLHGQERFNDPARRIFDLTNQDREAHNLQPLHWSNSLASAAQAHAYRMVTERYLSHDYPGEPSLVQRTSRAGAHFQAVAENIATGFSPSGLNSEWMHSPMHRANILDPRMTALGVGLVERNGTLYAVEDFSDASEALNSRQVEYRVGDLLRQQGIASNEPRHPAAIACESNGGYPPGVNGRLVIRFNTGDLSHLPGGVISQLHSGDYRRASVAACGSDDSQPGFTTFRVAIVLY